MGHGHEETKLWFGLLKPQYMYVFVALTVLTLVELMVPEPALFGLPHDLFSRPITVVLLIFLAVCKTVLVAAYYMHLVGEKPAIIPIACAPFLFSVFLTIGLFPYSDDVIKRQQDEPAAVQAVEGAPPAAEPATKE